MSNFDVRRGARVCLCLVLLFVLLWGGWGLQPAATAAPTGGRYDESQVKAVFVYNLLHFVYWPSSFGAQEKSCRIVVLGSLQIAENLKVLTAGETFRGKRVSVELCRRITDVGECCILFVGSEFLPEMSVILRHIGNRPVLLVGEGDGFLSAGGMVNFVSRDRRVTLEINPEAARQVGITFNSRLLRLARIVKPSH